MILIHPAAKPISSSKEGSSSLSNSTNRNNKTIINNMASNQFPSSKRELKTSLIATPLHRRVQRKVLDGTHQKDKSNRVNGIKGNNKTSSSLGNVADHGKIVKLKVDHKVSRNQSLRNLSRSRSTLSFYCERNTSCTKARRNKVKEQTRLNCLKKRQRSGR